MGASLSPARWTWLAWFVALASGGIVLLGFAVLAALSIPLESLGLMHAALLLWLCSTCGWILAVLAAAVLSIFLRRGRSYLWASVGSLGAGLALGLPVLRNFGFDQTDAVESAIGQYEPVVQALRDFELEQGHPPPALADLVPRYLDALPCPRFLDTDCTLDYRLVEGGWALDVFVPLSELCIGAEGFLVYLSSQAYEGAFDIAGTPLSDYDQSYRGWRYRIE